MKDLSLLGYLPTAWTRIIESGLSEQQAFKAEKDRLHSIGGTIFNGQSGERNYQVKLTNEQAREIFKRPETHARLAEEFKVSRSAISMIKSRKQWRAATACLV